MSAPSASATSAPVNGQTPSQSTSNNSQASSRTQPPSQRRRAPANPFAATQSRRRPTAQPRPNGAPTPTANGAQVNPVQRQPEPQEEFEDIPIVTTKRSLVDGMKHHVLRFTPAISSTEKTVNLFDESQFERPIRLHRRDPRHNHLGHLEDGQDANGQSLANNKSVDDKEREKQEALKAERRAQREADQALIAPSSKPDKPKKDHRPRKEQNFVSSYSDNVKKQKNMAIRYEEKLPWHVEDFENKQTWRGAYETSLSENHVALVESQNQQGQKIYRMLPMQKWYKFIRKNQYKTLSFQEADAAMKKGAADPLWIRKARIAEEKVRRAGADRDAGRGVFSRKGGHGDEGAGGGRSFADDDQREEVADADDIDFNAEEDFADDEEGPALFGKEEEDEQKETSEKVKKEQLEANVWDVKDQKDWDAEEEKEKAAKEAERKHRKRIRKALQEHEKNFDHDEESDEDLSGDDSEDSEIERLKEEEKRAEEERKLGEDKKAKDKDRLASGTSTVRSGTPNSVRPNKLDDPRRKALKRAGSPGLSDASGNESSSRKKLKQKHGASGLAANGANISRPGSPSNSAPNVVAPAPTRPGAKSGLTSHARQGSPVGAGSGSDVEMSDGGGIRPKKKGSSNTSPRASRPGSPAGSQTANMAPATAPNGDAASEVIKASIPKGGISMSAFVQLPAIKPITKNNTAFLPLLRQNADFVAATRTIYPKGTMPKKASKPAPAAS